MRKVLLFTIGFILVLGVVIYAQILPRRRPLDSRFRDARTAPGVTLPDTKPKFHLLYTGPDDMRFNSPRGIGIDPQGNIYVADSGNSRVVKLQIIDKTVNVGAIWGGEGEEEGKFKGPNSPNDFGFFNAKVYVADPGNYRIQKFSGDGAFEAKFGSVGWGNDQFRYPTDVTFDLSGNAYVVDSPADKVKVYKAGWAFDKAIGGAHGSGNGQFNYPLHATADRHGFVYVADTGNNRIQKFDRYGNFKGQWAGFSGPQGITIDRFGNIYVADTGNNVIKKFDAKMDKIFEFGGQGAMPGQFNMPTDVAVSSDGTRIFVADKGNNRIQVFDQLPTLEFDFRR